MGAVQMGVPTALVIELLAKSNAQVFVETGTYYGNTALWASQKFQKVFTIEFSHQIYESVCQQYGYIKNINFLFGDTREQLKLVVEQLQEPCILWLDAHWSGGWTYGENDECPILEELEIVNNSKLEHLILIDDARLFVSPPPPPHLPEQWPNIDKIIQVLQSTASVRFTAVVDDVIVSVPEYLRSVVEQYQRDRMTGKISPE